MGTRQDVVVVKPSVELELICPPKFVILARYLLEYKLVLMTRMNIVDEILRKYKIGRAHV